MCLGTLSITVRCNRLLGNACAERALRARVPRHAKRMPGRRLERFVKRHHFFVMGYLIVTSPLVVVSPLGTRGTNRRSSFALLGTVIDSVSDTVPLGSLTACVTCEPPPCALRFLSS